MSRRIVTRWLALIIILLLTLSCTALAQRGKKPPRRPAAGSVRKAQKAREDSLQKARDVAVRKKREDSLRQVREDSVQLVRQDSLLMEFEKQAEREAREDSLRQAKQDSLWKVFEKEADENTDVTELIRHYSHGWFPQTFPAQSISVISNIIYSNLFDQANDLRSRAFVPTTAPFTWHNPFESGEREIMQANKDKEEDDGYPETDFSEVGLGYTLNLPMPAIARLDATLQITDGLLFAHDTTRSYLTLSGLKRPLKEVSVLHLNQYSLAGRAGLNIPFYGAFVASNFATVSSYYYINASVGASYVVSSKATQYMQIANAKEEIRYGNGSDTTTVLYEIKLSELNRLRTSFDVALGWNVAAEFFTFYFEAFVSGPTNSILKDGNWREFYGGFRTGLGYQWYAKKKKTGT